MLKSAKISFLYNDDDAVKVLKSSRESESKVEPCQISHLEQVKCIGHANLETSSSGILKKSSNDQKYFISAHSHECSYNRCDFYYGIMTDNFLKRPLPLSALWQTTLLNHQQCPWGKTASLPGHVASQATHIDLTRGFVDLPAGTSGFTTKLHAPLFAALWKALPPLSRTDSVFLVCRSCPFFRSALQSKHARTNMWKDSKTSSGPLKKN